MTDEQERALKQRHIVQVLNLYAWCYGERYDPNRKACLGCDRAPTCRRDTNAKPNL